MAHKDWDDMNTNEKLELLRKEIRQLINAVNAINFGLIDKIGKVAAGLEAKLREVAKDVQALRDQREGDAA